MWDQYDFEKIENLHYEDAEDYSGTSPRCTFVKTFFTSVHNIHDFKLEMSKTSGNFIEKRHHMQLLYLHRSTPSLKSIYWLNKHHLYSIGYSQVRFLLELYLVVRELNRDKEKTKRKMEEIERKMNQNEYGPHETLPLTKYISGKRRQLRGGFVKKHDVYKAMYDKISNFGAHPNSIRSAGLDGVFDEDSEYDVFQFGMIFAFAIATQYRRTFQDTPIKDAVDRTLDETMVQMLSVSEGLPIFLEEDLNFASL